MLGIKKDAIEFVKNLPGGWNVCIYDPPYNITLEGKSAYQRKKEGKYLGHKSVLNYWGHGFDMNKVGLDPQYITQLKDLIISKMTNGFFIEFHNIRQPADYNVTWYKGRAYGSLGGYIRRNAEYIMIWKIEKTEKVKPDLNHVLKEVEEHKPVKILAAKPIKLLERLLLFTKAKYVIDPFAGTYSTYKACRNLGLEVDTCDKNSKPSAYLMDFLNNNSSESRIREL